MNPRSILVVYYAGTAVFLLLDYGFDVNVRLAFLDGYTGFRGLFYGMLFLCFAGLMLRPQWTLLIGAVESLVTLVGLILAMALRTMIVTDAMIETGAGLITVPELLNFMISGGAAYISWTRGLQGLSGRRRRFR